MEWVTWNGRAVENESSVKISPENAGIGPDFALFFQNP
jgi:hypothetical protein